MHGFPTRAPAHQSRDSTWPPSLAARTLPRPPTPSLYTEYHQPAPLARRWGLARDHPYPAWSPHSAERCPPPAVQLPHQSECPGAPSACGHVISEPQRATQPRGFLPLASHRLGALLTGPRASRLLGPRAFTSILVTRPPLQRGPRSGLPRYANCGRAKEGTKVTGTRGTSRRLVETAAGAYAYTTSTVSGTRGRLVTTPPARASTSRSAPSQTPRERAPNATSQRRWGGSTPNHPAALRSGMRRVRTP
jgi:hypothetical protein